MGKDFQPELQNRAGESPATTQARDYEASFGAKECTRFRFSAEAVMTFISCQS